jgi:hypothetical protein
MTFLSIERVSKYFPLQDGTTGRLGRQEGFCVFCDVDLRIDRGEFVTLIGHWGVVRVRCSTSSRDLSRPQRVGSFWMGEKLRHLAWTAWWCFKVSP